MKIMSEQMELFRDLYWNELRAQIWNGRSVHIYAIWPLHEFPEGSPAWESTMKNAAELVRRWNCHEEMVKAIQNFISVYAIWEIDPDKSPNTLGVAARQLNAILAATAKPL